jgi:nicotinamidase-related amidase
MKQKAERILGVFPSIFVKYGEKYASRRAFEARAANCAVLPKNTWKRPPGKGERFPRKELIMKQFHIRPDDTVVLIIDVQEKLMVAMDYRDQLYKNTGLLMETAKLFKLPVIVTEQYPRGLGHTVDEVKSALPEDFRLMEKLTFDACGDGLLDLLKATGRHTVLVCGTETHVCVYQTTRSLLENGYHVFPVQDAICSRFTPNYKSGLKLMDEMGAVAVTTETAVFDIMHQSGTAEFKAISKILK